MKRFQAWWAASLCARRGSDGHAVEPQVNVGTHGPTELADNKTGVVLLPARRRARSDAPYLRPPFVLGTSILAAVAVAPAAFAQPIFAPLAPPPTAQGTATFFSTNGMAAESILSAVAPDPESRNPLRLGPFAVHPRIDYQYINANGLPQGTNHLSSIQHVINPGASMQLSRHWRLDAGLSLGYYTEKQLSDTFGYNVGINGGIPHEDWTFGVSAGFGSSESSQIETAQQTKQDSYNLGLSAVYGRRRMTYEFGINQNISLSSGFNDSYNWSTMNWVNYILTPQTTVGLGLGGGYTMLQAGSQSFSTNGTDSVNEQLQGRVTWHPKTKLSVSLSGGAHSQQFLGSAGADNQLDPIYSLSAGWSPVDGTSFSLSGSQSVGSSITTDQNTLSTSLSFGFSQRLFRHFTLSLSPSYGITDYRSNTGRQYITGPPEQIGRSEETLSFNASLSTVLFKKVSTTVFIQFSDHQSDLDLYNYESRQFGLQLGYHF